MPRQAKPRTPPDLQAGQKPRKGKCDYCQRGPLIDMLVVDEESEDNMKKVRRPILVAVTTQKTKICVACFRVMHEAYYKYHLSHGILSTKAIR